MHTLIQPATACRQLGHRIDTRNKQTTSGQYEYCVVCTLGYEMALTTFNGDTDQADGFVQDLRRKL